MRRHQDTDAARRAPRVHMWGCALARFWRTFKLLWKNACFLNNLQIPKGKRTLSGAPVHIPRSNGRSPGNHRAHGGKAIPGGGGRQPPSAPIRTGSLQTRIYDEPFCVVNQAIPFPCKVYPKQSLFKLYKRFKRFNLSKFFKRLNMFTRITYFIFFKFIKVSKRVKLLIQHFVPKINRTPHLA